MGGLERLLESTTARAVEEQPEHLRWMQQLPIVIGNTEYPQHFAEKRHPLLWDNWLLQRLGTIKQLGQIRHILLAAEGTRQVHSLDSAAVGTRYLYQLALESEELYEIWDEIIMHAIFHDVGHWAYSHVVEDIMRTLTGKNHKQLGIEMLDMTPPHGGKPMSQRMSEHNIKQDIVKALMAGTHPAASIIADRTLGAEKIAYLIRDREVNPVGMRVPSPNELLATLMYKEGVLGLRSPNLFELRRWSSIRDTHQLALDLGNLIARQYATVYLSPESQLVSRHLQRMVLALFDTGLTPEKLRYMGDSELDKAAREAGSTPAQEYKKMADDDLTPSKLALRLEGYGKRRFPEETVYIVDEEVGAKASELFKDTHKLANIERDLGARWNADLTVTGVPVKQRFEEYNVTFFDKDSTYKLSEAVAHHDAIIKQTMRSHWAVRVHTNDTLPNTAGAELADYIRNN